MLCWFIRNLTLFMKLIFNSFLLLVSNSCLYFSHEYSMSSSFVCDSCFSFWQWNSWCSGLSYWLVIQKKQRASMSSPNIVFLLLPNIKELPWMKSSRKLSSSFVVLKLKREFSLLKIDLVTRMLFATSNKTSSWSELALLDMVLFLICFIQITCWYSVIISLVYSARLLLFESISSIFLAGFL